MTGYQIHDEIKKAGLDPVKLNVMDYEQIGGWKTAHDFNLHVPF
jgi:hypothetical protein